jgi:phosphatidylglycerophosphate synthase
MSELVASPQVAVERPSQRKKSDRFYEYFFFYVFWLPLSFTPNHVSGIRLAICSPIISWLILLGYQKTAGFILIFAALMDGLDGAMARIRNQVSEFGKLFDPLADKGLNIAAYLALWPYVTSSYYGWYAGPIIAIESVLALVAIGKYLISTYLPQQSETSWRRSNWVSTWMLKHFQVKQTGANNFGKAKMILETINLSALLLFDANADYFLVPSLKLPYNLLIFDFIQPILLASAVFAGLSLYGHLKVVRYVKS